VCLMGGFSRAQRWLCGDRTGVLWCWEPWCGGVWNQGRLAGRSWRRRGQSWAALASGTGGRWNQGEHMLARVRDSSRTPTNLQALLNQ
jgi:hypothetical protein